MEATWPFFLLVLKPTWQPHCTCIIFILCSHSHGPWDLMVRNSHPLSSSLRIHEHGTRPHSKVMNAIYIDFHSIGQLFSITKRNCQTRRWSSHADQRCIQFLLPITHHPKSHFSRGVFKPHAPFLVPPIWLQPGGILQLNSTKSHPLFLTIK